MPPQLPSSYRTAYRSCHCAQLREEYVGVRVLLCGWARVIRKFGALTFVDLADRYGICQIVIDHNTGKEREISRESVIQVRGTVRLREKPNPHLPTGRVEVIADQISVLSRSAVPPFTLIDNTDGGEELRMQYRFLDLRRPVLQRNLIYRHRCAMAVRQFLDEQGFVDIETPFLIRSTPEGARDFVVPSRLHSGDFYALPQSPQLFKQLLMLAGFDRYYQIVRCFRDEDLRADRQPEFTQIDCEMSFVDRDDVMALFERMVQFVVKQVRGEEIKLPFARLSWHEAMQTYGSDKPDLRFGMPIVDVSEQVSRTDGGVLANEQTVLGIRVAGKADLSRKQVDQFAAYLKQYHHYAGKLLWVKCVEDAQLKSSFDNATSPAELANITTACGLQPGDILFLVGGQTDHKTWKLHQVIGALRVHLAQVLHLYTRTQLNFLWILDFPLFEWSDQQQRYVCVHHPFTAPHPDQVADIQNPARAPYVLSQSYDMVLNGSEIAGGSIRIIDPQVQEKVFMATGFSPQQVREQFGFLLDAFAYGVPPHGGIAFGFDRLCALLAGGDSIRDFIAFPKNNQAYDPMLHAPASISVEQRVELSLPIPKENSE